MDVKIYLYDANGSDKELNFEDVDLKSLDDNQLLWIDVSVRDEKTIEQITDKLGIRNVPLKSLATTDERPKLDKFEDFYRFFVLAVETKVDKHLEKIPIDFLVGRNFVMTVHERRVEYFEEYRAREKGETHIGELDAESFIAALLDMHIVTYFRALEIVEREVDKLDEEILGDDPGYDEFLKRTIRLRGSVSRLRRWLMPQRDVFYSLSRPDFRPVAESDSIEHFKMLNSHFENAVDSIESSRDTVVSLFDLYATKSGERLNKVMHKLTFITLMVGAMGVMAGILGMNFKLAFFENENGFWEALLIIGGLALTVSIIARWFRWI